MNRARGTPRAWCDCDLIADESRGRQRETVRAARGDDGTIVVTAARDVPCDAQTATRAAIPLVETPQSISVVTRDHSDRLSFVHLQQAVRYTAGVFGEAYGPDPRYDVLTVRGFTRQQFIDGLAVSRCPADRAGGEIEAKAGPTASPRSPAPRPARSPRSSTRG